MPEHSLDVITIGRSSVDLYGEQVCGPLEIMQSFAKYVGGCPTNIGVGTSRLGLRSAVITRVGDETAICEPGDLVCIPREVSHSLKTLSSTGSVWLYGYGHWNEDAD